MSAYLMGRVFYTDLPGYVKLTLLALADHANDDGTGIFVSQDRLARKVGSTARSVRSHLTHLRAGGFVEKVGRSGPRGVDIYRIDPERLPSAEQIAFPSDTRPETLADRQSATDRKPGVSSTGSPPSVDRKPASTEPSEPSQPKTLSRRRRDPIFDTLEALFGKAPSARRFRGSWNAACAELRGAEATPEEITALVAWARGTRGEQWRVATPTALAANLGQLRRTLNDRPLGAGEHFDYSPFVGDRA